MSHWRKEKHIIMSFNPQEMLILSSPSDPETAAIQKEGNDITVILTLNFLSLTVVLVVSYGTCIYQCPGNVNHYDNIFSDSIIFTIEILCLFH